MSRREVIAYAITHAPKGVKGGPYEALHGGYGDPWPTLKGAFQWRGVGNDGPDEDDLELARMMRDDVRALRPDARVIRIVRARSSPSEASAVEVLRELVAYDDVGFAYDSEVGGKRFGPIVDRARAVLAGAGPDPMPVVRAALRFAEHCTPALEGSAWFEATREFIDAVDTYRKGCCLARSWAMREVTVATADEAALFEVVEQELFRAYDAGVISASGGTGDALGEVSRG